MGSGSTVAVVLVLAVYGILVPLMLALTWYSTLILITH